MSWHTFLEWKAFSDLEPFPDERADFNAAHIVQAVMRDGRILDEFRLPFGDLVLSRPSKQQPIEYQEMLIDAWVSNSNAIFAAKGVH
jgi:hypothetical protein